MKKIVVCIRQGLDGEISPFDAAAYECALRIPDAHVTLLSMGAEKTKDFLQSLSRRGAAAAVLLCDDAFAGADTLATAYTLSLAIRRLAPELILCGRQTLIGDTAQTGPMLAEMLGCSLSTHVMTLEAGEETLTVRSRDGESETLPYPALLTVERNFTLRFPRLGAKPKPVEVLSAAALGADPARIGLRGSPTRVLASYENASGKRKCRFIEPDALSAAIEEGRKKGRAQHTPARADRTEKLSCILLVGEAPRPYASDLCDTVHVCDATDADAVLASIDRYRPAAVLFGSDSRARCIAASVAARRALGLCADCTALDAREDELIMYRPALSGTQIAKIRSLTRPALATVRTEDRDAAEIVVCAGYGIRDHVAEAKAFSESLGAVFAVTRKLVDNGYAPYAQQVGLTGKTVSPAVYIALGVSGAIHHIVGMQRAGTVIAVNPDRDAPIFSYADFGVAAPWK